MSSNTKFTISERRLLLRIFDLLFVMLGIVFAASFENFYYFDLSSSYIFTWFLTLCVYLTFFAQIFEMYSLQNANDYFTIIRSIVATALATTVLYIFTPFIAPELPLNRLQIVYLFIAITSSLLIWRIVYIVFIFSPKYFKTVLLVGNADEIEKLKQFIIEKAPTNQIVACVSTKNEEDALIKCYDLDAVNIMEVVDNHHVSEIIVTNYNTAIYKKVHAQLVQLFEHGTAIVSSNKFKEREAAMMPEMKLDDAFYDVITFSKNHQNRIYIVFMRIADVVISIIGLIFMLLLIPFLLLGNSIANRGSLFYTQQRVGKKGALFNMVKFRTMVKDAEKNGAVLAEKNDSRITKFGKFLRNTRLDEVPQFYNILKGDMALIGPRPERQKFVLELEAQLPFYGIRHVIKPGLTGWAQVKHPYANNLKDQDIKMRYDLYYIKERSLFLDFKILVKTITTVLFFRGQ